MEPVDETSDGRHRERGKPAAADNDRRRALVRRLVAGAVLPGLLARKDAGAFDQRPGSVREPDLTWRE